LKYGNKTQRDACKDLISLLGIEQVVILVKEVISAQETDRYCPRATTPFELWNKIANFRMYFESKKAQEGTGLEPIM
jgi:hypothetical protein